MKKTLLTAVASLAIAATALEASASGTDTLTLLPETYPEHKEMQKAIKSTRLVAVGIPDSLKEASSDSAYALIGRFYADQFRNFQDPRAPYFMFMSKNAELAMGVGGVVRMRGWFDWNGSIPANGFAPYLIPM